jgi:hypothetical protein
MTFKTVSILQFAKGFLRFELRYLSCFIFCLHLSIFSLSQFALSCPKSQCQIVAGSILVQSWLIYVLYCLSGNSLWFIHSFIYQTKWTARSVCDRGWALTFYLFDIECESWREEQKRGKKFFNSSIWIERLGLSISQSWIEYFMIVIGRCAASNLVISDNRAHEQVDRLSRMTFCEVTQNSNLEQSRGIEVTL